MNDIEYGMIVDIYTLGDTSRISYGIAVYSHTKSDGTLAVIASVHDISSDKAKINDLVLLCRRLNLDPNQLCDVVDDFIAF